MTHKINTKLFYDSGYFTSTALLNLGINFEREIVRDFSLITYTFNSKEDMLLAKMTVFKDLEVD